MQRVDETGEVWDCRFFPLMSNFQQTLKTSRAEHDPILSYKSSTPKDDQRIQLAFLWVEARAIFSTELEEVP